MFYFHEGTKLFMFLFLYIFKLNFKKNHFLIKKLIYNQVNHRPRKKNFSKSLLSESEQHIKQSIAKKLQMNICLPAENSKVDKFELGLNYKRDTAQNKIFR